MKVFSVYWDCKSELSKLCTKGAERENCSFFPLILDPEKSRLDLVIWKQPSQCPRMLRLMPIISLSSAKCVMSSVSKANGISLRYEPLSRALSFGPLKSKDKRMIWLALSSKENTRGVEVQ